MRCYVITGISRIVIEEILRRNVKTLELKSAHNVATALKANIGERVFLTSVKTHDLSKGVSGVIADVTDKEVMSQSIFYASPHYVEECEVTVVRLRISPRGFGRIVRVKRGDILETTEADVVEVSYFDAR